ncbi:TauD domain-containing protein [Fusarium sp. LHS14.1]|nr:TauD domain-containing protein [Fusarium sp. LHS14.1]
MSLPTGFPKQLKGPMAWDASDFAQNPESYTLTLTESDLLAIRTAVSHFKGLGLPRGSVDRSNFPLPEDLVAKFRQINDTLNNGHGFQVVRGIDPTSYSEEEHILIFAGICAHVATHRNWFIGMFIEDDVAGVNLRPPELPVKMDFHTDVDSGPILALFMEKKSKYGGNQYLSSFWTIYNSLAKESPEVIRELASNWHWEMPDKENLGGPNIVLPSRPIIGKADGRTQMQINFAKAYVANHPQYPMNKGSPSLSPSQEDALKILTETARRHSLQLDTKAGDLVLVNNLAMMHARDAFVDDVVSGDVRHVLRLWLQDQDSWPVASSLGYIEPEKTWHVSDKHQSLRTLSEWVTLPRPIRAVDAAASQKHA